MLTLLTLLLGAHAAEIDFDTAVRAALDGAPEADLVEGERRLALAQAQALPAFQNPTVEAERIVAETELRASIPVPISGAPIARMQAASAGRRAAQARYDVGRAELAYAVGLAYLDAVAAGERAALASRAKADAERVRDAVIRLHEAGETSDVDRAVTEAVAAQAIADAAAAEQAAIVARMQLEALLGEAPTGGLEPAGWPTLSTPGDLDPSALPAALAESEEARAARTLRAAAALDRVPTPAVQIGRQWDPESGGGAIYGVAVEVPLFAPGVGSVRAAGAQARIAEAEAERAVLDLTAAVAAARRRVEAAEQAWAAISAVDGLDRALDDITAAFALGEFSILDYATRRQSLLGALDARIAARYRLESGRLDLWRLAGELPTVAR